MALVSSSATGIITAGSRYTLTCIALKTASGLTKSAQTQWIGPNGGPVASSGATVVSGVVFESLRTVQNITFSSLSTSDAGEYRCVSTLTSPALSTPYQTTTLHEVTVSGIFHEVNAKSASYTFSHPPLSL